MLNADVTACPSGFTYMYDACYAVPVQATSWIAANDVAADLGVADEKLCEHDDCVGRQQWSLEQQ